MRDWGVNPKVMCRKHLLGNHAELHMLAGTLVKGVSIKGYLEKGIVEVHNIRSHHDAIAEEMVRRGYRHDSPMRDYSSRTEGNISVEQSLQELKRRCPECRKLIESHAKEYC